MPCACGRSNIDIVIKKVVKKDNIQKYLHSKSRDDKLKILKNFILSKSLEQRRDIRFRYAFVSLARRLL